MVKDREERVKPIHEGNFDGLKLLASTESMDSIDFRDNTGHSRAQYFWLRASQDIRDYRTLSGQSAHKDDPKDKEIFVPVFPDELPPTVEEKIVGAQGLFVREWSKVAFWLGLAGIAWRLLLIH